MSVGFIILVHQALGRAAEVARHLAAAGCPVVIHADLHVGRKAFEIFTDSLSDLANVRFCERRHCEWGTWAMVAATQDAAELLLAEFPDVSHVYLMSGSCLPLRPVHELEAYLDAHRRTDFIESVTTDDVAWTIGGLDRERFSMWFPFSWKRHRRIFDRLVEVQRRLKIRRRIPAGLLPHLGSQWWCLTRETLGAILQDPRRAHFDRYFRSVWIPDESYFQTLARAHSSLIESRSLTLSKFDYQGKPHIFYDDHLQLLRRSDCFMARKIWPRAGGLYRYFLRGGERMRTSAEPNPGKIDRVFARAVELRTRGRAGLVMQSRFPNDGWENGKTHASYSVFCGFDDLFTDFNRWLAKRTGLRVHGHLFAPGRAQFAGGETIYNGGLADAARLRDYNPQAFLTNLIWNTRGERQCFQFGPRDVQQIAQFLPYDGNAQISLITGAWAVALYGSRRDLVDIRVRAARRQKAEVAFLQHLRSVHARAHVRVWSLAEFLEDPMENLRGILQDFGPGVSRRIGEAPTMVELAGFGKFLQMLRNQGMNPHLAGDFSLLEGRSEKAPHGTRPRIVG